MSVCQLVPDRSKIDEDQRAENREPFKYAEVLIDAGPMGLTNNRPYAMNAATPPSTRLMGTKLYSPRTM